MRNVVAVEAVDAAGAGETAADRVRSLRARMEQLQGRTLDAPVLPTHPALASLLPGRGLRPGSS